MKYCTKVLCVVDNINHISCRYYSHHNCLVDELSSIPTLNRRVMCMANPCAPCGATPPVTCLGYPRAEVISTLPQIVKAHPVSSIPRDTSASQSNPEEYLIAELSGLRQDRRLWHSQPSSPGLFSRSTDLERFGISNHGQIFRGTPYEALFQQLPFKSSKKMCSSYNDLSASSRKACDVDFVEPLDDRHKCPICLEVLHHPCQTECGHRFCHTCITNWITRDSGGQCPNCKEFVSPSKIYPDNYARREVESLSVRCPNSWKGCKTVCSLKDLNEHLTRECNVNHITARCPPKITLQQVNKTKQKENTEFVDWLDKVVDNFLKKSTPPRTPSPKDRQPCTPDPDVDRTTCLDRGPWYSEFEVLPEKEESGMTILKNLKRFENENNYSRKVYEIPKSFCSKSRFYQNSGYQRSPLSISSEMSLISRCSSYQATDGEAKMCF